MATLNLSVEIFYITFCAVIDLIVLIINPIIIGVIYDNRQLRRQPSIIYIANLTLVDLCLAAVNLLNILFHFMHVMKVYPICLIFHGYIPLSLLIASFSFMFTNSIDRFIFIRLSMKYHSIMKSRVARRVAIGIWVGALLFPLLPNVIVEHTWEYKDCSYLSDSKSYRNALIPVLAMFLITVFFTPLMFVSVFRIVKKSRRLRHVPNRSVSTESLVTTLSSPTHNMSVPTLPPISELIVYEQCQDSSSCVPVGPYLAPSFRTDSSTVGEIIHFPATRYCVPNLQLPPERISQYLRESDAKEEHTARAQTPTDIQGDSISSVALNNDLRSRNTAMLQPEGRQKNPWAFPSISLSITESSEDVIDDFKMPDPKDNVVYRNNVQDGFNVLRLRNYSVSNPLVDYYMRSVVVPQEEERAQDYSYLEKVSDFNARRMEEITSERMRHFRGDEKFHLKKKHRKHRPGQGNKITQFSPDFIKTKRRRKPWRRSSKVSTTIPTEPLEMLNFKLQMWNTSNSLNSSTPQQEINFTSTDTHFGSPSDGVHSNTHSEKERHHQLKNLRLQALKFGSFHPPRIRTRTISASDSSSLISSESASSVSLGATNENSANLSKINDTQSEAMYQISALQKKPTTSPYTDPPVFPISNLEASQRIYILTHQEDRRNPFERPPRPNRLSFRNRNLPGSSENFNGTPRSQRRAYDRTISTTSSTSSSPFGGPSYSGRDLRTLKILFIMFCVYIILWLPAFIIQTVRYFGFYVSIEITVIGYTLGVSNSVFNFFVYPMRIPKLRVSFKQLLTLAIADVKKHARWLKSVTKFKKK